MRDGWLAIERPLTSVAGLFLPRARHILEWPACTIPAFHMHTICIAPKGMVLAALRVPIIRHCGIRAEAAHLRRHARDVGEDTRATESAVHVDTVRIATMDAHLTGRVPKVWGLWVILEGTCRTFGGRCAFRARDARVREITTETALGVDPICPTSQLAYLAIVIPIVRNVRLVCELATAGRARHVVLVPRPAESAFKVLTICMAPNHPLSASRIPEIAHTHRLIRKLALASLCARVRDGWRMCLWAYIGGGNNTAIMQQP